MLTPLIAIGTKLIDKFIPDAESKAKAQMQLLEMQKNGEMRELELSLGDIQDARKMNSQNKDHIPSVLAFIIIIGYFSILTLRMGGFLNHFEGADLAEMITTLRDSFIAVVFFFFGSSSSSRKKDEILGNIKK